MKTTRRFFLGGTAAASLPLATVAAPRLAADILSPEQRIETAMKEIHAALGELYPGFRVQMRNDVVRPTRYVPGGPDEVLPPSRHAVVVYAGEEKYGREDVRWFLNTTEHLVDTDGAFAQKGAGE